VYGQTVCAVIKRRRHVGERERADGWRNECAGTTATHVDDDVVGWTSDDDDDIATTTTRRRRLDNDAR